MADRTKGIVKAGDAIADALRSVRFAGRHLIVPRHADALAVQALTEEGLVRDHLGHTILTTKGRQRFLQQSAMAGRRAV